MMNNFLYATYIKPQKKPGRQEPLWTILNWRHGQRLQTLIWPQFQVCETFRGKKKTEKRIANTNHKQTSRNTIKTHQNDKILFIALPFTCRARGCGRKHPGSSRRWPPHRRPLETTSRKSPPSKPRENATRLLSLPFSLVLPLFSLSISLSLLPFFPPSPLQPRLVLQHPVSFFFALLTHNNPCKGQEGDDSVRRERRNAKMRGRERRERASKKRERRLGLRIILQVGIGPELVFFFFLSFSF